MNLDINRIILFAAFVFMGAVFYYFINRMLGLGVFCGLAIQLLIKGIFPDKEV